MLARLRLGMLAFALLNLLPAFPAIALAGSGAPAAQVAAAASVLAVAGIWVAIHRRGATGPVGWDVIQVVGLAVMAPAIPVGALVVPLYTGLFFRSLYGTRRRALANGALFFAVLALSALFGRAGVDGGSPATLSHLPNFLLVAYLVNALAREVLRRTELEGRLRRQALHDPLTGLANRTLLLERVGGALRRRRPAGGSVAVLLLDLDDFKAINDTLGHQAGDQLLVELAARVVSHTGDGDTAARLGGDEFVLVLEDVRDAGEATGAAERVLALVRSPFIVRGTPVTVPGSIGVAVAAPDDDDADELVRRADVAMYHAKRAGGGVRAYAAEHDDHCREDLVLRADIGLAVERDQIEVHYQPKVELATGDVIGAEALARWRHPERGLLPPGAFLEAAAQSGSLRDLTRRVLDRALAQARAWQEEGMALSVAVNVTGADVLDPGFPAEVADLLRRWDVPARLLQLEITEDLVMLDPLGVLDVLGRLRGIGVELSLDDFGTGRASLAYLKRLPVQELKIDRSFVQNITTDSADAAIVLSTVELGHNLGLRVVAEGVECAAAWHGLAAAGCDVVQGYHLARPLPADELARWLERRGSVRAAEAGLTAQLG